MSRKNLKTLYAQYIHLKMHYQVSSTFPLKKRSILYFQDLQSIADSAVPIKKLN